MNITKKIEQAINSVSAENASNTPDFILAAFLSASLDAFNAATQERERWYGIELKPGGTSEAEFLRMQIGYLVTQLQQRGDPRDLPAIVAEAARACASPAAKDRR